MNAIAAAARYGMALDGSTAYVTHQPCFTCAKELLQAGIQRVYYAIALPVGVSEPPPTTELERQAELLNLRVTEARLLGNLEAVHVHTADNVTGLLGAISRFETERDDSLARGTAPTAQSRNGSKRASASTRP